MADLQYWSQPISDLEKQLGASAQGLSEKEAADRLARFGKNLLAQEKKLSLVKRVLSKFLNPLILILLFASAVSAILGDITDFSIILIIVSISIGIDVYQERHAQEAAEKLRQKVALTADVIRGGERMEIPLENVVAGDIVHLAAGDMVAADCRLISSKDLLINQSSLTGESYPQEKNADKIVSTEAEITNRINCVFLGTSVLSGTAEALIINTGAATELGKIATVLIQSKPETDFEKGIRNYGLLLMKLTLALVVVVFMVNSIGKHDYLNSFLFSLALAVGLTPELLPIIVTINLSRGAIRMSEKEVIVKDLPAIQNFGSMDVLATDKTGTLTEDRIELERYENISGAEDPEVLRWGYLNSLHQAGIKSPLEKAILVHKEVVADGYVKVDEIPFDFDRKRLSVILRQGKKVVLVTKGAPENLIDIATHYQSGGKNHPLAPAMKKKIADRFKKLSTDGFRVLALAFKDVPDKKTYDLSDENNLTLLGLMAFLDPPKRTAREAVQTLVKNGVSLKILTGDNELVTQKVCSELNVPVTGTLLGSDIDKMTDDQLAEKLDGTTIFARLNPSLKRRIILLLKKNNHVVGFLGDGINDAPSLQAADIGISVNNAVDVAKESADLILLRKDLHVLKDGILEGRRTFGNILKYLMMGTSSNFGNMFSVAGASLFLPFLPMLPVQILLNNLLYDLSQLSVPTDNVDLEYLARPQSWNIDFIKHFMLIFGPISSIFDYLTFFVLLLIFHAEAPLFQTGWFVESLVSQTLIIFSIRTIVVPFYKSRVAKPLIINSLVIAALGLLLPLSPLAPLFSFAPPPINFYLLLPLLILGYFVLVEFTKRWFYSRFAAA